jgi:hypothetical protein
MEAISAGFGSSSRPTLGQLIVLPHIALLLRRPRAPAEEVAAGLTTGLPSALSCLQSLSRQCSEIRYAGTRGSSACLLRPHIPWRCAAGTSPEESLVWGIRLTIPGMTNGSFSPVTLASALWHADFAPSDSRLQSLSHARRADPPRHVSLNS